MNPSRPTHRAVIATRIYEPEGAAAAYRLGNLTRALEQAGYGVKVLTTRADGARRSTSQIRRWPVLRDRSGSVRGYVQYASFDGPLFFRLLFGRRPDVVIAEPPPTTGVVTRVACFLRRVPYVYYSADVTSAAISKIGVNRFVVRVVTAMERWVLNGAQAILAVSDGVRLELEKLGADPSRITMVGTGIDTQKFRADGPAERPGHPYFIYAGTMSEFQGAEVFIDAFLRIESTHPDVRLIMFGGGTDLERLKQRAAPQADRIEFPGFVSSEVVARWMRGAVAGLASVRPGQGYDFAVPTKTLASVACGTPVIFAGVGPLRQIVSDRHLGWSVEWDNEQVAESMGAALSNTSHNLATHRVEWLIENFSLSAVAAKAAAVVDEAARRT